MHSLLAEVDLKKQLILSASPQPVGVGEKYSQLSTFIDLFIRLAFFASGIILLLLLIGGGFSIIASGGDAKGVENGKNAISGAIIGFLIIFAAYWIIQIIQTITGVPIFNSTL